jgi:hypothetical protein
LWFWFIAVLCCEVVCAVLFSCGGIPYQPLLPSGYDLLRQLREWSYTFPALALIG